MAESPETQLNSGLKQLLGHLYVMYYRAHSAHWNIEGDDFPSMHEFFGGVADDVFKSIDPFAESMRQHNAFVPVKLEDLLKFGTDQSKAESGGGQMKLVSELNTLNTRIMKQLSYTCKLADAAEDFGLVNFIQDRQAAHLKLQWMLKSMMKDEDQ